MADGPGQHGELRPEALVHPPDQLVPQLAGEVQVDVRQQALVRGDEPFQGQAPAQGVHVADADEVADQQGHRGAAASARRPLLQGDLRVGQPPFLHDFLGQVDQLPVEQQEPGPAVPRNQAELLRQPLLHRRGHGTVATHWAASRQSCCR